MEILKIFKVHIGEDQIRLGWVTKDLPQGRVASDIKIQEVFNQVVEKQNINYLKNKKFDFFWHNILVENWDINISSSGEIHAYPQLDSLLRKQRSKEVEDVLTSKSEPFSRLKPKYADDVFKEGPDRTPAKKSNLKPFRIAIAALSILALIATHKKFGTLNPMNIYKQVFPRNIPQ